MRAFLLSAAGAVLAAGLVAGTAQGQAAGGAGEGGTDTVESLGQELDALRQEVEGLKGQKGEGSPWDLRAYWKDGLRLDTADKKVQLGLGGRIQADTALFFENDDLEAAAGDSENGAEFRRTRIYVQGLLYDHFEFKAQYDFAGGDADFKDVYVGAVKLPCIGGVRVGQFKEPFGLEELTSSNYVTFMERSLTSAFTPARSLGFMAHNAVCENRGTWAVGLFRDAGSADDELGRSVGEAEFSATARATYLPIYEDEGAKLLHLGGAYSYRLPQEETDGFSERPEAHLANRYVSTGDLAIDDLHQFGAEAALVLGPFSTQGEFMFATLDGTRGQADPEFYALYVMASYFLTGEHRPYETSTGTFDRVRPRQNFLDGQGGLGAWEVACRYSFLDLIDGNIQGGELHDVTGGLNWYLNPNFRVMGNYIFSHLEDDGNAHILMFRFQAIW